MRSCALVVLDAGPLIKLALARELDLLLAFDTAIYIPDEVLFEAAHKHAWEHQVEPSEDKVYLIDWVKKMQARGLVSVPETLIGEMAQAKRNNGQYTPGARNHRRDTGELAAHEFFNNREAWGHAGEPALLLVDDGPRIEIVKIQNLDVHVLSTYDMLVAMQQARVIPSADEIWNRIITAMPTAYPAQHDHSVRGDTEYRTALRKPR